LGKLLIFHTYMLIHEQAANFSVEKREKYWRSLTNWEGRGRVLRSRW